MAKKTTSQQTKKIVQIQQQQLHRATGVRPGPGKGGVQANTLKGPNKQAVVGPGQGGAKGGAKGGGIGSGGTKGGGGGHVS